VLLLLESKSMAVLGIEHRILAVLSGPQWAEIVENL
jgi:hypothetical protein